MPVENVDENTLEWLWKYLSKSLPKMKPTLADDDQVDRQAEQKLCQKSVSNIIIIFLRIIKLTRLIPIIATFANDASNSLFPILRNIPTL